MAGTWGCPHEINDACHRIGDLPCNPGTKGCILAGRYVFADDDKNERLKQKKARTEGTFPRSLGGQINDNGNE